MACVLDKSVLGLLVAVLVGCSAEGLGEAGAVVTASSPQAAPSRLTVAVRAALPHDPTSYTQGLLYENGVLIESGGGYGRSFVRRWRPATGEILAHVDLPDDVFAEGLAKVGENLVQLTWREGIAYVRNAETLEEVQRWEYGGEGWGLCYDGHTLWMSDGTASLQKRDPRTFAPLGRIEVYGPEGSQSNLNELECAEGWIYANVYQSPKIVQIDPATGAVRAVIRTGRLLSSEEAAAAEVLNGIAYVPESSSFYITGKNWPRIFQVDFIPVEEPHE